MQSQEISFSIRDIDNAGTKMLWVSSLGFGLIGLLTNPELETIHAITIRTEPGKTYFLKRKLGNVKTPLILVDEDIGWKEIKKCKKAKIQKTGE